MEIKVYISNLGAYNRGCLVGKWLTLPMDAEELQAEIEDILNGKEAQTSRHQDDINIKDDEIAIHDYEAPFEIGEYENVFEINRLAEDFSEIDDDEIEDYIDAIAEAVCDREKLLTVLQNRSYLIVPEVYSFYDLAVKIDKDYLPFDYQAVVDAKAENFIDWDEVGYWLEDSGWELERTAHEGFAIKILE